MILPAILLAAALAPPQSDPAPRPQTTEAVSPAGSAQEHIDAGLKAYRRRRFADAEGHFRKAVEADPGSAAAHFYLGYAIYKRVELRPFHPDKAQALEMFAKAFSIDPTFKPTWGRAR
jgi:tetratricopeptide (TPR) repeat protein